MLLSSRIRCSGCMLACASIWMCWPAISSEPADRDDPAVILESAGFSLTKVDGKVKEAALRWKEFQPEILERLSSLKDLQRLTIRSGYLHDSAIDAISRLETLTHLRLSGKLTSEGVAQLSRLSKLRCLDLRHNDISAGAMEPLGALNRLEELVLADTAADATYVHHFPDLRVLILSGEQGDPNIDFAAIAKLEKLEILDVSHNKTTTDRGIARLDSLKRLRALVLSNTDVTDSCIDVLASLPSLEALDLEHTKVTASGISRIEQALPRCLIRR